MMLHSSRPQAGFTLIELLISMTLFSIVMTMAASTLLVLLDANAKAQNKQQILNNLTIAVDSMSREIRTGFDYHCDTATRVVTDSDTERNCNSGIFLAFTEAGDSLTASAGSDRVAYAFAADYYGTGHGAIIRRVGNGDGDSNTNEDTDWVPMTGRNTNITEMEFIVSGTTEADEQPTVTMFIAGEAGELAEVKVSFEMQTTVTQRPLDI